MSNKTNTSEQGTSIGLVNENNKSKSSGEQLIEYFQVENTPFTVARNGTEWFVLMGKYRFTEDVKTKKAAIQEARKMTWDRILQVITAVINDHEEQKHTHDYATKPNTQNAGSNNIQPSNP